ncbi:hypothetical protein MZD79_23855 [Escherichia coli]|nr:hypothetical protein [Escherichia coli]
MSKGPERASNQSDTCGCGITVMTVLTGHLIEKLTRHYPRLVLPAFLFVLRHIEFVLEFFIKPARSAAAAKEFRIQDSESGSEIYVGVYCHQSKQTNT